MMGATAGTPLSSISWDWMMDGQLASPTHFRSDSWPGGSLSGPHSSPRPPQTNNAKGESHNSRFPPYGQPRHLQWIPKGQAAPIPHSGHWSTPREESTLSSAGRVHEQLEQSQQLEESHPGSSGAQPQSMQMESASPVGTWCAVNQGAWKGKS